MEMNQTHAQASPDVPLRAVVLVCTLSPSPARSSSQLLAAHTSHLARRPKAAPYPAP